MTRLNQKRGSHLVINNPVVGVKSRSIGEMRGEGIFTNLINKLPSSDDTARPLYSGEKHMILKLPNGKSGVANYMGPGTQVIKRLERGDPGRTPADMVAKRHDIDFTLAQQAPNKKIQMQLARAADNRMINSLKKIQKGAHGGDAFRNVQAGLRGIEAKVALENRGLLNPSTFAGPLKTYTPKEQNLLISARNDLEQKGYGHCGNGLGLPGQGLKKKLLSQYKRDKMKRGVVSNIVKMSGRGLTLPGGELVKNTDLLKFITNDMVPNLMKQSGLKNIPMKTLAPIIGTALKISKGKNLQTVAKNLSSSILPLMTLQKLKIKKMQGSGFIEILSNVKKQLQGKLTDALFGALKMYISQLGTKGKGLKLAGQGMCGSGFFSSIGKAFKKVGKSIVSNPLRLAGAIGTLGLSEGFLTPAQLLKDSTGIKASKVIDTVAPTIATLSGNPEFALGSKLTSGTLRGLDL